MACQQDICFIEAVYFAAWDALGLILFSGRILNMFKMYIIYFKIIIK